MLEELLRELEIDDVEDFMYFDQFAEIMEGDWSIDYDSFFELFCMPDNPTLKEMTESFFTDLLQGVPDDDIALYAALQDLKDVLLTLAEHEHDRARSFYADELYRLREWLRLPDQVTCSPEDAGSGRTRSLSPLEALMLYREEKLSGTKYRYDYSDGMPPEPDEYLRNLLEELEESSLSFSDHYSDDRDVMDALDELPDELPPDYDPSTWKPGQFRDHRPFDPYRDGLIDRDNPVIFSEEDDFDGGDLSIPLYSGDDNGLFSDDDTDPYDGFLMGEPDFDPDDYM